ncbi:hypothetical protein BJX68DRAFT_224172 [Aspergillus pseudodeflectus]|uniref:Uncharacterized protein n=1 Tax=Aspergillus pseudodeflectus TaxID=176178 RepID=A0ABR4L6I3_9EURO
MVDADPACDSRVDSQGASCCCRRSCREDLGYGTSGAAAVLDGLCVPLCGCGG